MNVNKNVVYGQPTTINNQQNVMQPTSSIPGYPPGSSPYGYSVVRSSGVNTNHWRGVSYTSQGNWSVSQTQALSQNQHYLQESPLIRLPGVGQIPITSNTVHYHGDHLSTVSSAVGLNPASIGPGWNPRGQPRPSGLQGQNKFMVNSPALNTGHLETRQDIKSEDDDLTDPSLLRHKVLEFYMEAMEHVRVTYRDKLQELFFLQNGGNLVDYPGWRKRPNPQLVAFLNASRLDHEMSISTPTATNTVSPSIQAQAAFTSQHHPMLMYQMTRHPNSEHMDARIHSSQHSKSVQHHVGSSYAQNYGFHPAHSQPLVSQALAQQPVSSQPQTSQALEPPSNGTPAGSKSMLTQSNVATPASSSYPASLSSMYSPVLGSQEDIAQQARKEQEILHRVSELRKQGLWSASRLPKVHEPPRKKAHWDYLLEEMQWLATDFAQEKRWKRNMARKVLLISFDWKHSFGSIVAFNGIQLVFL